MGLRLPRGVLSIHDVRKVIEAAQGDEPQVLRDRAILETLYATGIRASELSNLRLTDIDTDEKVLKVVLGKGRKDRNVPLTTAACQAIEAYLAEGRPRVPHSSHSPLLFLAERGGRMHVSTLNEAVQLWTKKAGIRKRVTCHTFRHSIATHLLKGGADVRHVQKLLGHSQVATTAIYTRVVPVDLRKTIERAHPRERMWARRKRRQR